MRIIQIEPNPSGAYPPLQTGNFTVPPPGTAEWPDKLSDEPMREYNGFVTLAIDDGMVTGCAPNVSAWEAWKASQTEEASDPEPTEAERLRADVDFLAALQGVIL